MTNVELMQYSMTPVSGMLASDASSRPMVTWPCPLCFVTASRHAPPGRSTSAAKMSRWTGQLLATLPEQCTEIGKVAIQSALSKAGTGQLVLDA